MLKAGTWHLPSYLGSLRTQTRKGRLIPTSVTPTHHHHLYYKEKCHEAFFKETKYKEHGPCYDLDEEGHRFSVLAWVCQSDLPFGPYWLKLCFLKLFFRMFMSWSLSRALLGISDFKKSHHRWVEWFWHFKVQQVFTFFSKQKVHTGDVGWATLQANLYLHWTRRYFLFTPTWTHQELRKKLHLGEGSIEETQCALSSEKPWRVNQMRPQSPVSFAVWCIPVKIHCSLSANQMEKTRQNDQVFRCGSRMSASVVSESCLFSAHNAAQEVSIGFHFTFNLCRNIYMLKKKLDIIPMCLIFNDVVNK